ncbi:P-loop containing nucleoside triphosphate hydrolase protein [Lipomyces japonicus]|uniref:P-loop containing nucleoside triphosphate hydrolase protein n=1 Tax=Lipomyces japonicus TaxID=56871 RepID=UPI0034CE10CA
MASYPAIASFISSRTSLVNLPPSLTSQLNNSYVPVQNVVVEITVTDKQGRKNVGYAGWSGFASSSHDMRNEYCQIDPDFARTLNITEGSNLILTIHVDYQETNVIHLEPVTTEDWQIVELHAHFLESNLLSQIRVVSLGQTLLIHLSSLDTAKLKVSRLEPALPHDCKFAKIAANSEVIVAPKVAAVNTGGSTKGATGSLVGKKNISTVSTSSRRGGSNGTVSSVPTIVLLKAIALPHMFFEDLEHEGSDTELLSKDNKNMAIYVDFESVADVFKASSHALVSIFWPPFLKRSRSLQEQQSQEQPQQESDAKSEEKKIIPATKIVSDMIFSDAIPAGHVGVSPLLAQALGIAGSIGSIVKIEAAGKPLSRKVKTLTIRPIVHAEKSSRAIKLRTGLRVSNTAANASGGNAELRQKLSDLGILSAPITNKMRLPHISGTVLSQAGGIIELDQVDGCWILPPTRNASVINIDIKSDIVVDPEYETVRTFPVPESLNKIFGVDHHIRHLVKLASRGSGILLTGAPGSGKRSVLDHVSYGLSTELIYNFRVQCNDLMGERFLVIKELMHRWIAEASWYAPSVLILEDLDKLIPEEVEHMDSTIARQLAELFTQMTNLARQARNISVIATATSKESVHGLIISSHLIDEIVHLTTPDKTVRNQIMRQAIITKSGVSDLDLTELDLFEIAAETEGYLPGDMFTLAERMKHESLVRLLEPGLRDISNNNRSNAINHSPSSSSLLSLIQDDFKNAIKNFVPASLRGVNLQKSSVSWNDIGGLKHTKRMLLETLEWPTKYAPIFANCPLRLRSGILLYGYPGCGKTFLASAVAHECGLNFISIKGPEILNKYIGASEKSVRDLFDRAQAAKPCVLFFDEFDAIAPKRGHDSTGVTDRVVNQMLTQMDGAEGLDGVYVLAATSRPDLIDTALLRPGRIDKSVLCDMPSFDDRVDIITVVAGKMTLCHDEDEDEEEIVIEDIAQVTEGYSPADLQALLYNAHLEAIHDLVDNDDDLHGTQPDHDKVNRLEYFKVEFDKVKLKQADHYSSSLASSLSLVENSSMLVAKLEAIFSVDWSNMNRADFHNYDQLTNDTAAKTTMAASKVVIKKSHIQRALQATKPSISITERIRLAAVYDEFISGRSGDMPSGIASTDIGGRATLM